jgi:hypothetical protein
MNNIYINNHVPPPQALDKSYESNFKEKFANFMDELNEVDQIVEIDEKVKTDLNQLSTIIKQLNNVSFNDTEINTIKNKIHHLIKKLCCKTNKEVINIIINEINKIKDDNKGLSQFKNQLILLIK